MILLIAPILLGEASAGILLLAQTRLLGVGAFTRIHLFVKRCRLEQGFFVQARTDCWLSSDEARVLAGAWYHCQDLHTNGCKFRSLLFLADPNGLALFPLYSWSKAEIGL